LPRPHDLWLGLISDLSFLIRKSFAETTLPLS